EELARHVLEGELEVRVLEGRVVAGLVDGFRDGVAGVGPRGGLILGDDSLGRIAGSGRRHDVLVRPVEGVDEPDLRGRRGEPETALGYREARHASLHSSPRTGPPQRRFPEGGPRVPPLYGGSARFNTM